MPDNGGSGAPTLGEMIVANSQAASAAASAAIAAKSAPAYEPPAPPATASEASARLSALKAEPAWRDKLLEGSPGHAKEMRALQALIAKGDNFDKAIAGVPLDGPIQPSQHLTNMGVADALKEIGIQPEIIKDVIAGTHAVTKEEYQRVERWKADRMADPDWVAKYTAGGREERRKMTLANTVLSGGIREDNAA